MISKTDFDSFGKMGSCELANFYVDICAYNNPEAVRVRKVIEEIILGRFIEKYAEHSYYSEDCEDFHLTD